MGKHSRLKHYGLAVIACAVAVALAGPLDAPSSCFLLAIIASSLFGGTGPGLVAVGLSAIAFNFLFLPSPLSLSSPSSHYLRFGVFVVTAFATSQLVETKNRIEESRRRIEETLSSTQRRLSRATQIATVAELAASIAHEVSQPLSAVVANGRACIQWLSAEPADLANAKVAAERIIRDGKAAGEVVRHMRALFKKTALERIALNVNEVIEEVLSLIHDETVRKQIAVETDLEKRLPPTLGDRVQLQQVIFNLLLNGVEAMETVADRPKKLIVRSRMQSSDAILVEIRDYGTGVADSMKVFEAFYTTKEKGMGMGLSDLQFDRGSTRRPVRHFAISRFRHHVLFHSTAWNESARMSKDSSIVYVLDDDYRVREALTGLLSSVGFRVEVFASAAEYLKFKKPDSPACLVLDLQLPGMSGLDLQREIAGGDAPAIVFVTGHGDVPSSVRAMKAGAIEFLLKPFDDQELLRAIDAAIAQDREARLKRAELAELQRRYTLLTPREREVLPFVVAGLLNKQTAAELGNSEITIQVHRGQIMRKMAASSLADLVKMAGKLGIS